VQKSNGDCMGFVYNSDEVLRKSAKFGLNADAHTTTLNISKWSCGSRIAAESCGSGYDFNAIPCVSHANCCDTLDYGATSHASSAHAMR